MLLLKYRVNGLLLRNGHQSSILLSLYFGSCHVGYCPNLFDRRPEARNEDCAFICVNNWKCCHVHCRGDNIIHTILCNMYKQLFLADVLSCRRQCSSPTHFALPEKQKTRNQHFMCHHQFKVIPFPLPVYSTAFFLGSSVMLARCARCLFCSEQYAIYRQTCTDTRDFLSLVLRLSSYGVLNILHQPLLCSVPLSSARKSGHIIFYLYFCVCIQFVEFFFFLSFSLIAFSVNRLRMHIQKEIQQQKNIYVFCHSIQR